MLHGQGVAGSGDSILIESVVEDGTVEAIRISDASRFALGVQLHAEYYPQSNAVNRAFMFQLAEVGVSGDLFNSILVAIQRLRAPPVPV